MMSAEGRYFRSSIKELPMPVIVRHLALVTETTSIEFSELARVGAALQKQASRDLSPIWEISATVDAFPRLEDVPVDYWPVLIQDDIGVDAAGIHLDKDNQPFALVSSGPGWSVTASHETLEMLVDPFGNRLVAGESPKSDQGRVEFLVEVSDPSEAEQFGYAVNGIQVSDFYTPNYFDPVKADGVRYSYTSAITEPRQVLRGGYLSWHDPVSDHWWQLQFFGPQPQFKDLGVLNAGGTSLRSLIDRLTEPESAKYRAATRARLQGARAVGENHQQASETKARSLRAQIAQMLNKPSGTSAEAPDAGPSGPKIRRPPHRGRQE
jgi:hypothetical protein